MRTEKRKTSTAECTHAAVRLSPAQGEGVAETARPLGLHVHLLHREDVRGTTRPRGPCQAPAVSPQRKTHAIGCGQKINADGWQATCEKKRRPSWPSVARSEALIRQPQAHGPMAVVWAVVAVRRRGVYA